MRSRRLKAIARYSSLGIEFVVGAVLGFVLGRIIDEWIGIPPVGFAILLPMLATMAIFVRLYREVTRSKTTKE